MSKFITDREQFFTESLKKGCKVIEVTTKEYYVTHPNESLTEEQIKKEWFGSHLHISHAYRDGSCIGNSKEVVEVKFLKLPPKGTWIPERSSGYAGYRCTTCGTWIYENQEKICDCDK